MNAPLRNQRGVAMMMALVAMFILAIVAGEITYQSGVYSNVVFRQRDLLRATLLARSGLRLAVLQLKAAKQAKAKAKSLGLGENVAVIDKIWQTPLVLPPPDLPGLGGFEKDALGEMKKSLGLDGVVTVNILGENGRMSINQMVWPGTGAGAKGGVPGVVEGGDEIDDDPKSPTFGQPKKKPTTLPQGAVDPSQQAEAIKQKKKKVYDSFVELFNGLLEKKRQDDDDFRNKYGTISGQQLAGNILAWIDPNATEDGDNRDKNDYYRGVEPPYALKNAPVASDSEYHMIKGLDETLAKLVSDNFTVQTTSSLDVNRASMLLIHAVIPDLSADALDRISKRRSTESEGGPFKNAADFWNFVNTLGDYAEAKKKVEQAGIKILDDDTTYHVVVTAQSGLAARTFLADVGPLPPKDPLATATATATSQPQQPKEAAGSTSTSTNTSTTTESGGDDSLSIVYLRSE